ncbi:DNA-3-methyladenine glycosylase I [Candidatus Fermentibacteria bacterium]|nr:DNA-3-methyladenine glycosylase I [Candidatus Fermentibacteria bacterium]
MEPHHGAESVRCPWPGADELAVAYHDTEWGVPLYDDGKLFEFLILEGAQAGLSWITILRKRERYREAFAGFDPRLVARFSPTDVERLMADSGIVRNRRKIEAAISNARSFLAVQEEFGSFSRFMWGFIGGVPILNRWATLTEIPAVTPESRRISAELVHHGFRFVGPTIIYAHMQATGMVNDHLVSCFRHSEVCRFARPAAEALR